jgi:hypothetical protein
MGIGSRHFILVGDDVIKITNRANNDFYFKRKPVFKQYAGQIIDMADVYIEFENRVPQHIVKIDCLRRQVTKSGSHDEQYERGYLSHMMNNISGKPKAKASGSVINATEIFNGRRIANEHTHKLSQRQLKKIMDIIFK